MSNSEPHRRLSFRESCGRTFIRGSKGDDRTPRAARFQMISLDTNCIVVDALQIADTFWSRFVGLQFRREMQPGHGLLLVPCRSIHTCWMRFAVDVIFLDARSTVLDIRSSVVPWRTATSRQGRPHATLEVAAGSSQVSIGERLQLVERESLTNAPDAIQSSQLSHTNSGLAR